MQNDLYQAAEKIKQADGLLICAGAGMSVDSGLPDFRSVGGFWNAYPPLADTGLRFDQIATPRFYQDYPTLAYWFFAHRLNQYRQTMPHNGYQILQKWAKKLPHNAFVFTSNVDGHFQKSGFDECQVYEVHGTLHRLQCVNNCCDKSWSSKDFHPIIDEKNHCVISELPNCPDCGGVARQNVLMFDDFYYSENYQLTKYDLLQHWLNKVEHPIIIELGAGKAVSTVRHFSDRTARLKHCDFIRINPLDNQVAQDRHFGLALKALEALTQLDDILESDPDWNNK